MKALLCKEYGPPESLSYEEIDDPEIKDGHVLVDIYSASVNFPDVLMIEDKYQFKPPLPFPPGGESSGIITEIGSGVSGFNIGDRVIVSSGFGSFAEKILVDPDALTIIPDEMDHNTASAFLMTYGTSHHALKDRADIKEGESLLVLGAAGNSDDMLVMYGGEIMEIGKTENIYSASTHPYTQGLMSAVPRLDDSEERLITIPGNPPNMMKAPVGCPFSPRCKFSIDACSNVSPVLSNVSKNNHLRACHVAIEKIS